MESTYHITWFDSLEEYHSRRENFKAANEFDALTNFRAKYPDAFFLSCVSTEVLDLKNRASKASME